jgi:septum formation protein
MPHNPFELILASQSPRRAQLLRDAGYQFIVIAPDDEAEALAEKNREPEQLVVELALRKAENVVHKLQNVPVPAARNEPANKQQIVLAADTIAFCQGQVLGKPVDRTDARSMLRHLSGQLHLVLTGVCLWEVAAGRHIEHLEVTELRMDKVSEQQLENFLDGNGWQGKAGAFGYQDGLDWVQIVDGLASNVVGLPVERLPEWLRELESEIRDWTGLD